jgi:uncharacterized protein (TIGR02246 family)
MGKLFTGWHTVAEFGRPGGDVPWRQPATGRRRPDESRLSRGVDARDAVIGYRATTGGAMLRALAIMTDERHHMEFAEAVDRHLATVGGRDLDGYLATVHDDVSLIMPDGRLVEGRAAVAAVHRDWFDDPDWSWDLTPVRTVQAQDTGVAVVGVEYHDVDQAGQSYTIRYLLSLTFARLDGAWLLLHDQNTPTP